MDHAAANESSPRSRSRSPSPGPVELDPVSTLNKVNFEVISKAYLDVALRFNDCGEWYRLALAILDAIYKGHNCLLEDFSVSVMKHSDRPTVMGPLLVLNSASFARQAYKKGMHVSRSIKDILLRSDANFSHGIISSLTFGVSSVRLSMYNATMLHMWLAEREEEDRLAKEQEAIQDILGWSHAIPWVRSYATTPLRANLLRALFLCGGVLLVVVIARLLAL